MMDNFPDLMVDEVYVNDNDDMDQFSLTSSTTSASTNSTTTTTNPYFFLSDQKTKQHPKYHRLQSLQLSNGKLSSTSLSSSNDIEEPSFYQVCQVYWNEIRQFLVSPAHKVYRWIRYISQHKYDFCFQLLSKCFLVWIIHTVWSSSSSAASIRRELNPDTYVLKGTMMEKVPTIATTVNTVTTTATTPEQGERGLLRAQPTYSLSSLSQEDMSQSQTMNEILKEYQSRSQVQL